MHLKLIKCILKILINFRNRIAKQKLYVFIDIGGVGGKGGR